MILNNTGGNRSKSAVVSKYIRKNAPNLLTLSCVPSESKAGIIVSVELVKISSIQERVDYIIKKTRPEKQSSKIFY